MQRNHWRTVRFDQIAHNIAERVEPAEADTDIYVGLEHLDPDSLRLQRWGTPADVQGTKLRFYPGDVIFGRRRAYQRKLAVAEFEGICSAHAMVLRAKPDVCLPEFLPFFLQSDRFFERALAISVGSLSPTINWKTLAVQEFPLPPLDEQRRIAEILWAAEEASEKHSCVLTEVVFLKEAYVGTIITDEAAVPLVNIADVSYGLTVDPSRRSLIDQRPYLRVANVQRDRLDLSEVKSIGYTESDVKRYQLRHGDLLVVEGHANADEIGRAAIWCDEIDGCLHQNHILRVRCLGGVLPEYLLSYLNSLAGRKYFRQHAKSTSGLHTINSTVLAQMRIPLLPVEEQETVVRMLSEIEAAHQSARHHCDCLATMKLALREELMKG